jgi:hypothetical protein
MALEKELETFKKRLPEWLDLYHNKYVLIMGEELIGVFDEPRTAYQAGVERFGNVPMLIRQVRSEDETSFYPALMLGLIDANP